MRVLLLLIAFLFTTLVHGEPWQVVVEPSEDTETIGCVLKSETVNGVGLHYAQRIFVVSSDMLDEAPHKTMVKIDRAKVYHGQQRGTNPGIIYITNDTPDIDDETAKIIYLLKRGRAAYITAVTILSGTRDVTITLDGFSAAYKQYRDCLKEHTL